MAMSCGPSMVCLAVAEEAAGTVLLSPLQASSYSVVQSGLVHLVLGHPALRGLTRRLGSLSWGLLAMPLVPLLIVPIPCLAAEACSGADEHTTDRSKLVKVADK